MSLLKSFYGITILVITSVIILTEYNTSMAQVSQQQSNPYNNNSFGNNSQSNNSGFNQQQGNGLSNGFGSSRQNNRLSGRNGTGRSSRRNSNGDANLNNNGQVNPSAQPQSANPPPSRRSGSGLSVPNSPSGSGSPAEIMIHADNHAGQETTQPNKRQNVPKPRIATKSYFYLEASQLAAKIGEPVTLDVKLSGLPDAKMDRIGFVLSYNPDEILPVQGQGSDGKWIPAQSMKLKQNVEEEMKGGMATAQPFLMKNEELETQSVSVNMIQHQEGKMIFFAELPEPQKVDSAIIARIVVVPIQQVKFTRIEFVSHGDETADTMSYLRLGDDDVLGSASDPHDGMIPLDLVIQSGGADMNPFTIDDKKSLLTIASPAAIELKVNQNHVDVGDVVELDIVLLNPSQLPVDEVEFLIMYNTRILQIVQQDKINPSVMAHQNGLQVNKEKGILQFKGELRKTKPGPTITIATVRFKAVSPTTKTTFKALVHKDGSLPSTGAYYKGNDILGDPTNATDGVYTTSVTVQPTVAFIQQKQKRY